VFGRATYVEVSGTVLVLVADVVVIIIISIIISPKAKQINKVY
jgi:hypothetical protein